MVKGMVVVIFDVMFLEVDEVHQSHPKNKKKINKK